MKNCITNLLFSSVLLVLISSCNSRSRYLDLNTGEPVKKDEKTGVMVNAGTGEPVTIYVDRESNDTIWGKNGKVVNGQVAKNDDGKWQIKIDNEEYKAESGDAKIKSEDGDYKVKDGDYKKKVEKDGDVKIKDGDKTIKIDGETGEKKVERD
jgi:hypothetical protein